MMILVDFYVPDDAAAIWCNEWYIATEGFPPTCIDTTPLYRVCPSPLTLADTESSVSAMGLVHSMMMMMMMIKMMMMMMMMMIQFDLI